MRAFVIVPFVLLLAACAPEPTPPLPPAHVTVKPPPKAPAVTKRRPHSAKYVRVTLKCRRPAKRRAVVDNSGPDLPYPCWLVRMKAGGKTNAQLAAEGRARGIKLSRKQERQALACLGRKP